MAQVILTIKLMPESPDVDLDKILNDCQKLAIQFNTEVGKHEIHPVAFGLKALLLFFVLDESKGSPDDLEEALAKVENVRSVEVTDVRRALG